MELVDVKRVPTKGGSLRYTIQRAGGPLTVQPSVAAMIKFEEELGLYRPEMFREFAKRIESLKTQTLALLCAAKTQGKRIAGYGASITATTLIYHFDMGQYFEYLVDDNLAKQGRFSPGLHLPVYAPPVLYERKPQVVVVLAWRYAEPIIKKYPAILAKNTQFLIPVPEVRVLGSGL